MRLFSTTTIQQSKLTYSKSLWAKEGWQTLQQRVLDWHHQPQSVPVEAGGWIHNYICPEHWLPLEYDGQMPHTHVCPAGHHCHGEKYNAAWRVWRHRELSDLAREAALAFAVLDMPEGQTTALAILNQYADFYQQFDGLADAEPWMTKGRAFNQALTEALWAMPLIHAYDLVAETLTQAEQAHLITQIWQPLTAVLTAAQDKLIANDHIRSNYMSWLNVAIGCLGFVLADDALIERAIESPAGHKSRLNQAIFPDGLEYEGTPYYHNFVLLADLILSEAATANGIALYDAVGSEGQTLTKMGQALAQIAWPDGSIPDLAEGSYWQDSIFDAEICQAYEILHAREPNELFEWVLQAAYERTGNGRDHWAALLYGQAKLAKAAAPSPHHSLLPHSGIAVLRSENELAALVPFGPYRKAHHQHDRLSLTVWPFSRDAGSPLYGLPTRKAWYPHSYAHNTLVVDGHSHANCGGELLAWNGHCLSVSMADAYADVYFERLTELKDNVLCDTLVVQSGTEHTLDWVFHIDGDFVLPTGIESYSGSLAESTAAQFIDIYAQKWVETAVTFNIYFNAIEYQLTLQGEQPFTLLLGTGPGTSRQPLHHRHVLVGRTVGKRQIYTTAITQK